MTGARDTRTLADEFVLGLLDVAEEAEVRARLATDTDLQSAVGAARDRFLELDLTAEPVADSPGVWPRIEARLTDRSSLPEAGARSGGRRRMSPAWIARPPSWRLATYGSLAAALVLAALLGWQTLSRPAPQVIAVLLDQDGQPLALVEDFGDDRALVVPLADLTVPADRSLQVWTLPSRERGPVSLGLLPRFTTTTLTAPDLPAPRPDQLYEITLEPVGGSPTGRPTGPVLVKGFARAPR